MKTGDELAQIRADDLLTLWEGYCGQFELAEADAGQLRLGLRVREALEDDSAAEERMRRELTEAGWREGPRDGLWRTDAHGGSFKMANAYLIATAEEKLR